MYLFLLSVIIIGILYCLYNIVLKNRNYWRNRNVPYVKPLPIFGNFKDCLLMRKQRNVVVQEICKQFPNEPYFGYYYGTMPALVIQDLELIKLVLLKDFYYFNGREASEHNKEMFAISLPLASGDEWKVLRQNLTPLFSSLRLKNLFYLIRNCSESLEKLLAAEIKKSPSIEVKKLLSRYTMDCISSCAFGFDSETMKQDEDKNPFTTVAYKVFDFSVCGGLKTLCRGMWPELFYALGFKVLNKDAGMFFTNLISDVLKKREDAKTSRNDFVDLLLTWKNENYIYGDRLSNVKSDSKQKIKIEVNNDLLIAQCVIFFGAGFETTATALSYLLFELAKNNMVQEKLIKEVDAYFAVNKSIEYECINTMPYAEACIDECLRLYPALGVLTREVMHDYTLPTGLRLEKGIPIHIPVYHIHRNPKYFPEPDIFRPERCFGKEKKNIKPYTFFPFGEGPRICIGMRFAKLPIHAAILTIFKNYRVELAENMPREISLSPKSANQSQSNCGFHIKFIPRN